MESIIKRTAQGRALTDASLGAERATADLDDRALALSSRRRLDDLIEHDRILADSTLSKFRHGADHTVWRERCEGRFVDARAFGERDSADQLKKVEREMSDATLLHERKRSDVAVEAERREHDALRLDIGTLRQATDDGLSSERQGADSTAEALSKTRMALLRAQSGHEHENQVLAMVSHDLRSPLGVILLNAEGIVETTLEPSTRTAANSVMRGVARMERLLCDLLDLARIESGTLTIVKRQHEVGALLLEVLKTYEPMFAGRDIAFTVDTPIDSVEVFFDYDRIVQVLSNLLGNAMKFTPGGGVVVLRAKRQPRLVVFTVHNDGPGILPSALPHIFERFWQADNNVRRGLGLGLSICRAIVEAHGGQIWAESEVDKGTTLQFTLPIR